MLSSAAIVVPHEIKGESRDACSDCTHVRMDSGSWTGLHALIWTGLVLWTEIWTGFLADVTTISNCKLLTYTVVQQSTAVISLVPRRSGGGAKENAVMSWTR